MRQPTAPTPSMPKNKPDNGKRTLRRRAAIFLRLLRSSRGKDIFIFLLFLGMSYVFWLILTLNDDMQRDLKVKFEIDNVPADVTFISEVPEDLLVSVRDKGTVLTNYTWGGTPSLKISYSDLAYDGVKDRVMLGEQQLGAKLRSIFGSSTQIVSMKPDSLSLVITNRPASTAVVEPQIDVSPAPQCVISGPITVSPDTVTVYSARHLRIRPKSVKTVRISRTDIKDTLTIEARLMPEPGTRIVPDKVMITVPVEPLISKKRDVQVRIIGAADNNNIVLFPSRVMVSYLLPMSLYNSENGIITVSANYARRANGKLPLELGALPDYYRGVELSTDSVEYLIEQRTPHASASAKAD